MIPPLHPDSGISAVVLMVIGVVQVPSAERAAPRLPPLTEREGVLLIFACDSVTTNVKGLPEGEGAIAVGAFDNLVHNRVRHIFISLSPVSYPHIPGGGGGRRVEEAEQEDRHWGGGRKGLVMPSCRSCTLTIPGVFMT